MDGGFCESKIYFGHKPFCLSGVEKKGWWFIWGDLLVFCNLAGGVRSVLRRVWHLRIQLQEPASRKLHALHKKQERLFIAAAPVSVEAKRALSAFLIVKP